MITNFVVLKRELFIVLCYQNLTSLILKFLYTFILLGIVYYSPLTWYTVSHSIMYILTFNDGGGFMADLIPDIIWGSLLVLFFSALYALVLSFFYNKIFFISTAYSALLVLSSLFLMYLIFPSIFDWGNQAGSFKMILPHLIAAIPAYFIGKQEKIRREIIEKAIAPKKEKDVIV